MNYDNWLDPDNRNLRNIYRGYIKLIMIFDASDLYFLYVSEYFTHE